MMKLVLIILFVSFTSCINVDFSDLRNFGDRLRRISLELFYFTEKETEGHVAMAPFTIWNLLSLVAFKTSADSWRQLYSIIGISKRNGQYYNSIFKFVTESMLKERLGASFKSIQIVFYDTSLEISRSFQQSILKSGAFLKMLNFSDNVSAANLANDYIQMSNYSYAPRQLVFNKTDFEESSMILSSAVEFSGDWSSPFNKSSTILKDGLEGTVHMMHQRAKVKYIDIELLGASVLDLPYGKDQEYTMIIIRPNENVSVEDVLVNFDKISFTQILDNIFKEDSKEMDIELPRFSVTSVLILNDPLISMDVGDIFLSGLANFSGISNEKIYISAFEHRAVITVSEKGTVATASTPANLPKLSKELELGRVSPFLYFIVYRPSYCIVFCGKYGV